MAYFGGTYESAKSDERVEFQKMLKFARQKKAVTHIIVYSYDRFSRTGANGAYISDQLKKQGIATLSATQEVDVDTAAGSFQQNLYYMFSQFDNELRRDKTITGMKEKLRKGYWFGHVPLGYINLNPGRGKEQNIVSNEDGKLIGLAFKWKAREGLTYSEISKKLKKMGLIIRDKRLSDIFRNPFYCGLITHKLISGEVIVGKHEGVVSKELFLKVNKLLTTNQNGYSRDEENLPLKQFVKSADCGTPYTGYIVRKKNLYYYKNNRIGSKENRNAKVMHNKFVDLLKNYELADKKYIPAITDGMLFTFKSIFEDQIKQSKKQKEKLIEVNAKLDRLEERFVFEEISNEQYIKFKVKLEQSKSEIEEKMVDASFNLSNLDLAIDKSLQFALNLSDLWVSGGLDEKRTIQQMIFPSGILFDFKNDCYRTTRVNNFFSIIPLISISCKGKRKGTTQLLNQVSLSVAPRRLELRSIV